MLIKKFKTNEEKNILNWWNDWGLKTPDIECLPKKGYVVTYNNIKVAAGYLYYTNAKIAYVDFVISNINYREKNRNDLITALIDYMVNKALKKGCKFVWATKSNKNIVEKVKKLKYKVLDKKHDIIYKYS